MNGIMVKLYTICDHTPNHVDNFKRFVAFAVDWFLGYLLIAAPIAILWLNQTKDLDHLAKTISELGNGLGMNWAVIAALLSVVCAIVYYVVIPWKQQGQTVGKHLMGIKIVTVDDQTVGLKTLCIRQILGVFVLEGYLCIISEFLRQLLLLQGLSTIYMVLSFLAIGVSAISIFIGYKFDSHRFLHDYLAKTKVVNVEETVA